MRKQDITVPMKGASVDTQAVIDKLDSDLVTFRHMALILSGILDDDFDRRRGTQSGTTWTFQFQESGIDATHWLVGELWSRIDDVCDFMTAVQNTVDAEVHRIMAVGNEAAEELRRRGGSVDECEAERKAWVAEEQACAWRGTFDKEAAE